MVRFSLLRMMRQIFRDLGFGFRDSGLGFALAGLRLKDYGRGVGKMNLGSGFGEGIKAHTYSSLWV